MIPLHTFAGLGVASLTNAVTGYSITSGAQFDPSSSAKLTRTFGTPTDGTKITVSCWALLHQSTTNAFNSFLGVESPVDAFYSRYDLNNALEYRANNTAEAIVRTNALYRDVMPTHFLLSLDTSQATATDRVYVAINGVQNTSFSTELDPSLNYASGLNSALTHVIGSLSGFYSDFTLYEHQVFDGKSVQNGDLTLDQFVEINAGVPNPVEPNFTAADYGNNGSYLKFEDGALGIDSSGKGNDWTVNGTITAVTNTPTEVECTWNPLKPSGTTANPTYSNGNLTLSGTSGWESTFGTLHLPEKFYFRVYIDTNGALGRPIIGVVSQARLNASPSLDTDLGASLSGYWVVGERHEAPDIRKGNAGYTLLSSTNYANGDYIDVWGDLSGGDGSGKIWFGKNGTPWEGDPEAGTGASFTNVAADVFPVITSGFGTSTTADFSQDSGTFKAVTVANITPNAVTSGTSIIGFNWTGGTPSNISGPTVTAIYGTGFVASNAVAFTCDVDNPIGGTVMPRGQAN